MFVFQTGLKSMNKIWVITGKQGVGKTSYLKNLVNGLRNEGFQIGGIIAEGTWKHNKRDRFDLVDLKTNQKIVFCCSEPVKGWHKLEHFYINPLGQQFGDAALDPANLEDMDLIIIDEIGPFELQDKGWAGAIQRLLDRSELPMIWTIRERAVFDVFEKWNIPPAEIINVEKTDYKNSLKLLLKELKK
jgi:nucleoside-triphosphatase